MGRCATENDDLSDFELIATPTSAGDIAEYVAELSDQLAYMAAANKFTVLASLLQLASVEAKRTAISLESHSAGVLHKEFDQLIGLRMGLKIGGT